jgi:hypothetical protein
VKDATKASLRRYVEFGILPGDFLQAVLRNDLMETVCRADSENLSDILEICQYVYCELPAMSWRSQRHIDAWVKQRGLNGPAVEPKDSFFEYGEEVA